jgi:hypothetical protein
VRARRPQRSQRSRVGVKVSRLYLRAEGERYTHVVLDYVER